MKRVTLGGVKQLTAYTFTPSCTVRDCAALKVALLDLLRVDGDVTLDVGAIERIDTAALQLLVAFVRDRKANSRNVLWAGSTASFYEAVNITGLGFALDLPITRHVGATA
ncbi:MAG: STAS domain-containing protein [Candidatus Obscuribacterales bacterium]|nr:STAS domain-containing protein [Steroidobacteraceae bacterium]